MKLSDVRAVVTGAASGLGRRFALELACAGAHVAAGDVNEDGLRELETAARGTRGSLTATKLDVSQEASVKMFVETARSTLGSINVVVNNAGVLLDGVLVAEEPGWVKRLPTAQWRRVLDVNLSGAFFVGREAAVAMLEQRSPGVIVNISSLYRSGNHGQSSYAASKAAIDALTRTWALELAPHGIRVAAIAPGLIATPILENISDDAKAEYLRGIPLRRFGEPEEIWQALRFIIECEYFNGSILEVDGGACI